MRCAECGLNYCETSAEDRRYHRRIHDETVYGLRRPSVQRWPTAWRDASRSVVVINSDSPRNHRRLAQDLSLVAAGDTQLSNVTYHADEAPDHRQIHLFVGVTNERAEAYMCLEKRARVWRCTWSEYEAGVAHLLEGRQMWSIGFVWVSHANRRRGWVRTIMSVAADRLGFGGEFGWYTPFTETGEGVARALCPSGIYIAK